MGNQHALNNQNKNVHNQNLNFIQDNIESGYYIKTTNEQKNIEKIENLLKEETRPTSETQSIAASVDKLKITQPIKEKYTFEWREGGNNVVVTGSWVNWEQVFVLKKDNHNIFTVELELPATTHQYKFIVDGQFKYSKYHPICTDGKGNTNNFLDLIKEKINDKFEQASTLANTTRILECSTQPKTMTSYSQIIPSRCDMNTDALVLPIHFSKEYNLNRKTNQDKIGDPQFLVFNDKYNFNENNSFKSVSIPEHIRLNHLSTTTSLNRNNVLINSTVQRVRNKFLTITYYKPIN